MLRAVFLFAVLFWPASAWASRVYFDPYAGIRWGTVHHLTSQFHDHVRTMPSRIASYDDAGYDAVAVMHYSGIPTRNTDAWTAKRWPPEDWFTPEFLASLRNIKVLFPSAEEVGVQHVSSPFMTAYIEWFDPAVQTVKLPHQYSTLQEVVSLVREHGGLPTLAHPVWSTVAQRNAMTIVSGYHAIEIYNGHTAYHNAKGWWAYDALDRLTQIWDVMLLANPRVFGVSVNDHYGPYSTIADLTPELRDSGKTIVLAADPSFESFRAAVESGAMFAVKDLGPVKNRYARVNTINMAPGRIIVGTSGNVTWIANGLSYSTGPVLDVGSLPLNTRYVRAQISSNDGSVVYTQAWGIRPSTADMNLDGTVGLDDLAYSRSRKAALALARDYGSSARPALAAAPVPEPTLTELAASAAAAAAAAIVWTARRRRPRSFALAEEIIPVETSGIEPPTPGLQSPCSPN
jgi:hypothetical protein